MSQTVRRSDSPTVHLIPHTHWDREWYLPLALFQAKLVPVLDEALELLESDATQRVSQVERELLDYRQVLVPLAVRTSLQTGGR